MNAPQKQKCAKCGAELPLWDFAVVWCLGVPYPHTVCLGCSGGALEIIDNETKSAKRGET